MTPLHPLAVWPHELRVLGVRLLALPLLALAGCGAILGLMAWQHAPAGLLTTMVTVGMEAILPLAVGLMVASVLALEPAIELQLALPTPYRLTAFRRMAMIVAWTALIEALVTLTLRMAVPWALVRPTGVSLLTWLAPVLWLAAVGALLALLLRSRSASGAVLGGLWTAQHLFHTTFATIGWLQIWFLFATIYDAGDAFWLANRIALLLTAGLLGGAVWLYLRHADGRFTGEEG